MKHTITIPCDPGGISDGYHTFDELYEHRSALFLALMSINPDRSWVARRHEDDTGYEGYFIAGLQTPEGFVTYHLRDDLWQAALCTGCAILPKSPHWDGHTPDEAVSRLMRAVMNGSLSPIRKTPDSVPQEKHLPVPQAHGKMNL